MCDNPQCDKIVEPKASNFFSDHKNIKQLGTEKDMIIQFCDKEYFVRLGETSSVKYCDICREPMSKQENLISFADILMPKKIIEGTDAHMQIAEHILMIPFFKKFYNIQNPESLEGRLQITMLLASTNLPAGERGIRLCTNKLPRPIDRTLFLRDSVLNILHEMPRKYNHIFFLIATNFLTLVECK